MYYITHFSNFIKTILVILFTILFVNFGTNIKICTKIVRYLMQVKYLNNNIKWDDLQQLLYYFILYYFCNKYFIILFPIRQKDDAKLFNLFKLHA